MSVLSSIHRLASEYHAARMRYRTERAIRSLPTELQKDIGWPQAPDCSDYNRRGSGSRADIAAK